MIPKEYERNNNLTGPIIGCTQAVQCPFGIVTIPCFDMSVFKFPSIASRLSPLVSLVLSPDTAFVNCLLSTPDEVLVTGKGAGLC